MNDLSEERLHALLSDRAIRFHETLASTNEQALEWLAQGAAAGSLVVADYQTEGRGRLGRTWYAPPGTSLLMTYVMQTSKALAVRASMIGALAVAETLRDFGGRAVGLKYPNDVQIARRKVAGVLAEAVWGDEVAIALGIGLNVRLDFAGTPYVESATSVESALQRPVDRAELLASIVGRLDFWRARLSTAALPAAWRSYLNMLGEWVEVHTGSERLRGIAADVSSDGALVLRDRHGRLREVWAGDLLAPGGESATGLDGDEDGQ